MKVIIDSLKKFCTAYNFKGFEYHFVALIVIRLSILLFNCFILFVFAILNLEYHSKSFLD